VTDADRGRREVDRGPAPLPGELPATATHRRRGAWALLADRLGGAPELLLGLPAVAIFVFWATAQGGTGPTTWYPCALLLLGLLVVTVSAYRSRLARLPPLVLAAIAVLALFTAWNFLSITWADDQGTAWDGANRCLLYLTVFAIFAIPAWRPGAAALLLGIWALAVALVGGIVFLKAAASADPLSHYLIAGRFAEPTGYQNANPALFTMALFPALFLAARRETPWPLRGLMLACAGLLFQLALLPQSRGWLIAAPIALIAYLVIAPGFVRNLTMTVPLAAVLALTGAPIVHVFDVSDDPSRLGPALHDARSAMAIAIVVLFAVGTAIGFIDRRITFSERAIRISRQLAFAGAALIALVGVVVAIAVIGNPASWASDRWHDFRGGRFEYQTGGGSRLGGSLGSNRYDFWRVAADEFAGAPIAGVGAENFAEDYVQHRRSLEEPTYPHNLPLQVLSETGVIGGLLFGSFLVLVLIGVVRARTRASPFGRGVAAVKAVVFVYWFVHSIGDWFWVFAGLSAPVFAWLAIGMRVDGERGPQTPPRWAKRWALPAAIVSGIASLIAAASLFLPWGAAVDVKRASESWGTNSRDAFKLLDHARDLNFLSAQPDLVAGAISAQLGERRRMRSSFDRALERDPRNWYATLELAALDALEGDPAAAQRGLDRVAELNPREPLTAQVRQGVLSGRPISLEALDRAFFARYCQRLGRAPAADGSCK